MIANSDLIGVTELARILGGVSKATVWRGVKDGRFPKPIKLGRYICRWSRTELEAHLLKLMQERTA
jgi:predicted DNA-binding transcriptional regulator AlpA